MSVKILRLTNSSKTALVDVDVYKWARHLSWRLDDKGYIANRGRRLHRMVLGLSGRGNQGDHKDGNKLDNRRKNLRLATHAQNLWNVGKKSHNKSGFKGVYLESWTGKYRAEIRVNGRRFTLGRFYLPEAAAMAYDRAAKEHHGEFAKLNFPISSDYGTKGRGCG